MFILECTEASAGAAAQLALAEGMFELAAELLRFVIPPIDTDNILAGGTEAAGAAADAAAAAAAAAVPNGRAAKAAQPPAPPPASVPLSLGSLLCASAGLLVTQTGLDALTIQPDGEPNCGAAVHSGLDCTRAFQAPARLLLSCLALFTCSARSQVLGEPCAKASCIKAMTPQNERERPAGAGLAGLLVQRRRRGARGRAPGGRRRRAAAAAAGRPGGARLGRQARRRRARGRQARRRRGGRAQRQRGRGGLAPDGRPRLAVRLAQC